MAGIAEELIRPGPAGQRVVAGTAMQDIGAGIAGDRVVKSGADDVLDVDQRVTAIACRGAGSEIDRDSGRCGAVIHRIGARPAI